jgi:hypothetical protein
MKKQYLHLSAYRCDMCRGPVVTGWLGVRESAISKEVDIRQVGATCISCGHRQEKATEPERARHVMPMEWGVEDTIDPLRQVAALVEEVDHADPALNGAPEAVLAIQR